MLHGGGPGASGLSNYSRNVAGAGAALSRAGARPAGLRPIQQGRGPTTPSATSPPPCSACSTRWTSPRAHVVGNSLGGAVALRMALEQPQRVGRLVLMGPGGIGMSQGKPTDGLKRLLGYYAGEGPTLDKLRSFIRQDLVFDGSRVSEALLQERFEASHRPRGDGQPAAARAQGPGGLQAPGLPAATRACRRWPTRRWCCGAPRTASIRPAARWPCKPGCRPATSICSAAPATGCSGSAPAEFNAVVAAFLAADA